MSAGEFLDHLRRHAARGEPLTALIDEWQAFAVALETEEPELKPALEAAVAAARERPVFAREAGLASAAVTAAGRLAVADASFTAWFEGEAVAEELARAAIPAGKAVLAVAAARDGRPAAFALARGPAALDLPLSPEVRRALLAGEAEIAVLGFCPSRAAAQAAAAARALGLTPLETRLAAALVDEPRLPAAARRIGVGYETAREAMASALRKTGSRRQADFVAQVVRAAAGEAAHPPDPEPILIDAFGVSARQAALARRVSEGLTRAQAARSLGISEHVAKAELAAVFGLLGVSSAADLARIVVETVALSTLAASTDVEAVGLEAASPLRLIRRRRAPGWIAIDDHGPRGGEPVIFLHAGATGRWIGRRLTAALQTQGLRPIAVERPGFGLTDPAEADPFAAAGLDLEEVLDALRLERARFLLRGGGASLIALARRAPERIARAVLINPHPPHHLDSRRAGMTGAMKRLIERRPELLSVVARLLAAQSSQQRVAHLLRRGLADSPVDLAAISDPQSIEDYARSMRVLSAGKVSGFAAEQAAYGAGWTPGGEIEGSERWVFLLCRQDPLYRFGDGEAAWRTALPRATVAELADAGRLAHLTHPDAMAAIAHGARGAS